MADEKTIKAHIAAFAVTDIYYFISKNLNHDDRLKAIKAMFNIMNVVSIARQDIDKAISPKDFIQRMAIIFKETATTKS